MPRPAAFFLALLALTGCDRGASPPVLVRLLDHVADASIETPLDPPRSVADCLGRADRRSDVPLADALAAGARHSAAWLDPVLAPLVEWREGGEGNPSAPGAAAPVLHLFTLPLQSLRPHWIALEGVRPLGPGEVAFSFEVWAPVTPAELRDEARVESLLRGQSAFLRPLGPARDDPARLERIVVPERTHGTAVVGLLRRGDGPIESEGARVRFARLDRRDGWLLRTLEDEARPLVRTLEVGSVTREALLLAPPCRVALDLVVPRRKPRLRLAVAALWEESATTYRLSVAATGEGASASQEVLVPVSERSSWHDVEVDLAALAGRRARLEIEVEPPSGRAADGFVLLGDPCVEGEAEEDDPLARAPDVILISLDTVRRDRLSLHGYGRPTSPALERLGRGGAVFETAIAPAPWTLPSHASLLSGLLPDRHGAHGPKTRVARDAPWLPSELRARGYETVAVTGGGYVHPEFGFARGFESYAVDDPAYPQLEWAKATGDAAALAKAEQSARARQAILDRLAAPRRRPLFLFLHTYAAHDYAAPPALLRELGAEEKELPALLRLTSANQLNLDLAKAASPEERAAIVRRGALLYDAAVRVADDLVADVERALERSGRLERAIVVVTSDHGEELAERTSFGHGQSVHEEMIRVPLVVHGPGVVARRVPDVVSLADVAPTLRDLLGLAAAADGRSLVPLLAGDATPLEALPALSRGNRRDVVFRSLRGRREKWIETLVPGQPPRGVLYDLEADPLERSDVAGGRSEDAKRLGAALASRVAELRRLATSGRGAGDADVSGGLDERLRELGYLGGGEVR